MNTDDHVKLHPLLPLVGRVMTKVERLRYEFKGEAELEGGDVQLWFGDAVVHLGVGAEGELLHVTESLWQDPFAAPLSPENDEYVAAHGKWTLVDVSREVEFVKLIGKRISEVIPLTNQCGRLVGVRLMAGEVIFNGYVDFDEFHVSWGLEAMPPNP